MHFRVTQRLLTDRLHRHMRINTALALSGALSVCCIAATLALWSGVIGEPRSRGLDRVGVLAAHMLTPALSPSPDDRHRVGYAPRAFAEHAKDNLDIAQQTSLVTATGTYNVRVRDQSMDVYCAGVDGAYFGLLRVEALTGRLIGPEDERGDAPVAVISERFWEDVFERDPSAVGASVRIAHPTFGEGVSATIVGVAPNTPGVFNGAGVWATGGAFPTPPEFVASPLWTLVMIVRANNDHTLEDLRAEVNGLWSGWTPSPSANIGALFDLEQSVEVYSPVAEQRRLFSGALASLGALSGVLGTWTMAMWCAALLMQRHEDQRRVRALAMQGASLAPLHGSAALETLLVGAVALLIGAGAADALLIFYPNDAWPWFARHASELRVATVSALWWPAMGAALLAPPIAMGALLRRPRNSSWKNATGHMRELWVDQSSNEHGRFVRLGGACATAGVAITLIPPISTAIAIAWMVGHLSSRAYRPALADRVCFRLVSEQDDAESRALAMRAAIETIKSTSWASAVCAHEYIPLEHANFDLREQRSVALTSDDASRVDCAVDRVSPEYFDVYYIDVVRRDDIVFNPARGVSACYVNESLAALLPVDDPLGAALELHTRGVDEQERCVITGIVRDVSHRLTPDDEAVRVLAPAPTLYVLSDSGLYIAVALRDAPARGESVAALRERIDAALQGAGVPARTGRFENLKSGIQSGIGALRWPLRVVLGVTLFVGVVGLLAHRSVLRLQRALDARRRFILFSQGASPWIGAGASMRMHALGAVLGCIAGLVGAHALLDALSSRISFEVVSRPITVALGVLLVVLCMAALIWRVYRSPAY